jgi:hypothetical protein
MDVSLLTLLIVAAAVVLLLAKYWMGSHSTPVDHSNLQASPPRVPENSNEFLLNRAYRCFGFLGLVTLPLGLAALQQAFGIDFDKDSGIVSRGVGQTLFRLGYFVSLFLSVPIFAGMLYATIYGIRQTVRFRHPALVALSVVSIVFWGGTMIYIPNVFGRTWLSISRICVGHRIRGLHSRQPPHTRVVVYQGQTALQEQGSGSGINFWRTF